MAAGLAEADRQRRDLVANASHELRTPIAGVQATLENLIDGVVPCTPATLAAMHGQVERLARLVHDLLDLSRLEAGAATMQLGPVALVDLVHGVVADLGHALPGLRVDVVAARDDLKVHADADRLAQVLTNLLTNAARYCARVQVIVDEVPGGVQLAVVDDGPGIPPGEEGRIFERFYRADRARNSGGSGLGLAISRWIVELHGGRIRAERLDPHGCRMVVELPRPDLT
jgi:signal transduction histidine kinase